MNFVNNKMTQAPSTGKVAVPEPVLQLEVVGQPQAGATQTPDHSLPPAVGHGRSKTNKSSQNKN